MYTYICVCVCVCVYETRPQAHCSKDPSLMVPHGAGPQVRWALGHNLVIQYMALSSLTYDLGSDTPWGPIRAQKPQWDRFVLSVKSESLPINFNFVGSVAARGYKVFVSQYCLGEYHCRIALWRQEPIPMPLPLFPIEHPLRTDGIGPPITRVRSRSNHNTSTYLKL